MLIAISGILVSIAFFYFGIKWLIRGSSALAVKAGISPRVTGFIVVAFSSSLPVLFTSLTASLTQHGSMVIGTVMGSTLFNILVVMGATAFVSPLKASHKLDKIDIFALIISTLTFIVLFSDRNISRLDALVLLAGASLYGLMKYYFLKKEPYHEEISIQANTKTSDVRSQYSSVAEIAGGIALLIAGSVLLIKNAITLSKLTGVGETITGFTLISACTSLPLLLTFLLAARRNEPGLTPGNIIGTSASAVFTITGISSLANPLSAIAVSNIDLFILLGVALLQLSFLKKSYLMKRDDGIFRIALYLIYLYYLWPK